MAVPLNDGSTVYNVVEMDGYAQTINGVAMTILEVGPSGLVLLAQGTTVPTAGSAGFAKGARFLLTSAAANVSGTYTNIGTTTSANFQIGTVGQQTATVNLSSADILALKTTPKSLVAAPGAGFAIIVDEYFIKTTFGTVAYTGANALECRYTNGSGTKVTGDVASATSINVASGTSLAHATSTTAAATANAAVVLAVPVADPAAGDGTAVVTITYRIVATT